MFIWLRARFHPICNTLFCLLLVLSLPGAGLADEPQAELVDGHIYLPLVLKIPSTPPTEATGILDPEFGGDGLVTNNIPNTSEYGRDILIQPDGKLVVGGEWGASTTDDFVLIRYNPDGSLDTSFSGDGKAVTDFSVGTEYRSESIRALVLQPDGRIIAAGESRSDFALARYLQDGSLDPSFSEDGKVITDFNSTTDYAYALALQADGKIIVAGYSSGDFSLARYNDNGSLDFTFDGDGKVTTDFGDASDWAYAIALQEDGKIVVAGYAAYNFALARYNPNGSLDNTFSEDGKTTTDFYSASDYARSVIIQSDEKIVVGGYASNAGSNDFALARYNPDGTLDSSFSGDGKLSTALAGQDYGYHLALQPDGKLVLAGASANDFALARYDSNGNLDTTFSENGWLTEDYWGNADAGYSLALQDDGKLVVAGYTDNGPDDDFALARFTTNGVLDESFDFDGKVTTNISGARDRGHNVLVQPDGKILVVGYSEIGDSDDLLLLRYLADGSLDPYFHGGWLTLSFDLGTYGEAIALQPDGKIFVVGTTLNYTYSADFVLARFNSDGSPDNTYSSDCVRLVDFSGDWDWAYDVLVQPDGKIVVAGTSDDGVSRNFALVRSKPDGVLDSDFSGDGKVTTDFGGNNDYIYAIAQQPDGKIVAAGYSAYNFAVARYNPDGTLDNSFSGDGKLTTDFFGNTDTAYSVVILPDGKILVAGSAHNGTNNDFALVRYNPDGSPDTSFSGDGKLTIDLFGYSESSRAMLLQPNNKILMAGIVYDGINTDFALVRINPDGSLDTSLDQDGILFTDFFGNKDYAFSLGLQPDSKIVVAGFTEDEYQEDIALARYK